MLTQLYLTDYQLEPREIIKKILIHRGLTNRELSNRVNIAEQSLSKMLNGGRKMTDKSIAKISQAIGVPFDVLKYDGDVEPYLSASMGEVKATTDTVELVESEVAPSRVRVERVKRTQLYLSELPEKDAELYIPYYDVEITAGLIEQYFEDEEERPEGYIYAPQYRDCIACNVKGNSMYDKIFPGARLYVYHLKNRKYIDFGQVYLVVLDGYRLLKYIDPDPKDESRVILRSYNADYKDWPVEKQDIIHLFLVKGYENQTSN